MSASYLNRWLLTATGLVLIVGFVDSLIDGHADSAALFAIAGGAVLVCSMRVIVLRPVVRVRRDQLLWLQERAVSGDESIAAVVDRAVGAYRAGLTDADHPVRSE